MNVVEGVETIESGVSLDFLLQPELLKNGQHMGLMLVVIGDHGSTLKTLWSNIIYSRLP